MSKLNDLKLKYAETSFLKADWLALILFRCRNQTPDAYKIHKSVYVLQNYPDFEFKKFLFSGWEPYSDDLYTVLFFWGVSGQLKDLNCENYKIDFSEDEIKDIEKRAIENNVDLNRIDKLAEYFKTLLN